MLPTERSGSEVILHLKNTAMKKLMLLSLLSMMFIAEMCLAGDLKSFAPPQDHVWINLKFIFHRPKFDCQRGFGICLIVTGGIDDQNMYPEKSKCIAKGQVNAKNQLVIEVKVTDLSQYDGGSALPFFQEKQSISILDPYTLPDETCKALGLAKSYTINPGLYPVSFGNGAYTIVFQ
jgi:hypothetical protein